MEDASLDDFLDGTESGDPAETEGGATGADSEDDRGESSERGGGQAADPAATAGPDTVASTDASTDEAIGDPGDGPVTVTYRAAPGGSTCDECGGTVDTQWRDGEAFLCADCKSW